MLLELGGTIDENGKLSVFRQADLRLWINTHRNQQITLSLKLIGKHQPDTQLSLFDEVESNSAADAIDAPSEQDLMYEDIDMEEKAAKRKASRESKKKKNS